MFSRLDTNFDLQLDQSEIKSLYLDRNEPCSDTFFKSCDIHTDKVITSSEWCTCFQRYTGMTLPQQRFPLQMSKNFARKCSSSLYKKNKSFIFSVFMDRIVTVRYIVQRINLSLFVCWIKLIQNSLLVIKKVHCSISDSKDSGMTKSKQYINTVGALAFQSVSLFAFTCLKSPESLRFQIRLVKQNCPASAKNKRGRNCLVRHTQKPTDTNITIKFS